MLSQLPVRPVEFQFHMRHDCPWCKMIETYVARPLEAIGVARFQRILINKDLGGEAFAENRLINRGKKVKAPLIILYETGNPHIRVKYFGLPKEGTEMESIAELLKALMREIERLRGVKVERMIDAHPLIRMILTSSPSTEVVR